MLPAVAGEPELANLYRELVVQPAGDLAAMAPCLGVRRRFEA